MNMAPKLEYIHQSAHGIDIDQESTRRRSDAPKESCKGEHEE